MQPVPIAARTAGVSRSSAYRWISEGKVPGVSRDSEGTLLVDPEELTRMAAASRDRDGNGTRSGTGTETSAPDNAPVTATKVPDDRAVWLRQLRREVRSWAGVRLGPEALEPANEALERAVDGSGPGEDEQVRSALVVELVHDPKLLALLLGKVARQVEWLFGVPKEHAEDLVSRALVGLRPEAAILDDEALSDVTTFTLERCRQMLGHR